MAFSFFRKRRGQPVDHADINDLQDAALALDASRLQDVGVNYPDSGSAALVSLTGNVLTRALRLATASLSGLLSATDFAKLQLLSWSGNRLMLPPDYTSFVAEESGNGDAHLRSPLGFGFLEAKTNVHILGNSYYDGTNHLRFDTAATAMQAIVSPTSRAFLWRSAPAGANPIASFPATTTLIHDASGRSILTADTNDLIMGTKGAFHLGSNLYFDGANWQRYDTTKGGLLVVLRATGGTAAGATWEYYAFDAGANPITFTGSVAHPVGKVTGWTALSYATNWSDFGSGQATGQYRVGPDGRVYLKGLVKKSVAGTANDTIATLPAAVRPSTEQIFATQIYPGGINQVAEVRINTAGSIYLTTSNAFTTVWTSLSQIAFDLGT